MKKIFLFATIIACFFIFGVSASAIEQLPEDSIAYVVVCDTCERKTAYEKLPQTASRKCYYTDCDGTVDYTKYTYCAKEYFYAFDCRNSECKVTREFDELPEGTADAPYGTCYCGTVRTEEMFKIDYRYKQYSRPCFYCYKVQAGTKSIYDSDLCPYCGETYTDTDDLPDSVDENGKLIYGGGGDYLYYCSETNKFYEAEKPADNEEVNADCPYCDRHNPLKINIVYSTTCSNCGTRAEYKHLRFLEKPIALNTFNNVLVLISLDITNGSIDPTEFDISNQCLECKHSFADDKNLIINRHVDAPKEAIYEKHANDLPYSETNKYAEEGSEYDNFFEKMLWHINYFFNNIKKFFQNMTLLFENLEATDVNRKANEYTYKISFSECLKNESELIPAEN